MCETGVFILFEMILSMLFTCRHVESGSNVTWCFGLAARSPFTVEANNTPVFQ